MYVITLHMFKKPRLCVDVSYDPYRGIQESLIFIYVLLKNHDKGCDLIRIESNFTILQDICSKYSVTEVSVTPHNVHTIN